MTEGNMQGEGEPIEAQTVEQGGGEQTEDLEAKFQKMLDEAKAKWEKRPDRETGKGAQGAAEVIHTLGRGKEAGA